MSTRDVVVNMLLTWFLFASIVGAGVLCSAIYHEVSPSVRRFLARRRAERAFKRSVARRLRRVR